MKNVILVGMLAVFVGGCASAGVGSDGRRNYWMLKQSQMRDFKPGVTTKADVERALGKPHSVVVFANLREEDWDYGYMDGTIRKLAQFHFDLAGNYKYHDEIWVGRSWRPYN